ncbi:hypothetical protein V8G54_003362 [Vigna mungo]|uniref:Protein kinase domain-containing protein n=1 Tax=Vigna mungo TaxID=3915 RepID=A0AAQ3PDQ3_VIGMU
MDASGLLLRIILFILIIAIAITNAHTQSFQCLSFSSTCIKHLKLEGSASASGSAIHLTEENNLFPSKSFGSAGRVTYAERINLRDKTSNEPRDFITKFSFVVSSNQSIYGDETWWINITHRKVCNCSIVYNSRNSVLNVSYTGYKLSDGKVRKTTQHLSYSVDIRQKLPDSVVVGISAATGKYSEQHTLLSWSFSITPPSTDDKEKERKPVMITLKGIGIGAVLFLRGFGGVYKGYFKDSNTYAAIKRISADSKQGVKQYTAEVTIISQLRHRNLVKLTGWCHKKNDFLLIYEYMENGSLDSKLFRGESILPWEVRYNIALGLASALLYLQEEWEKCVLHRDIKSSNIMLDSNFNPKLGDFGLARLVDHDKGSETTDVESDIFSFGVVLLEIATGRKAIHHKHMEGEVSVVEWVWKLYELRNLLAAADENLRGEFDVQQMECLLVVGLWCANPDSASRPAIRQVINVLNSESSLPILPLQMPVQGCS